VRVVDWASLAQRGSALSSSLFWLRSFLDVAVEVDPEPGEFRATQPPKRIMSRALRSSLAHDLQIDHGDGCVLDPLAACRCCLLGISAPELNDILVENQRPSTLKVGDDARAPARGQRQIHRGGLATGFGIRLVEVGVAVDEQQAEAPAPAQGQKVPEQDRTVAAEHDRDSATVENLAGGVGEFVRVVPEPRRVEQSGGGVARRVVRTGNHTARVVRTEGIRQTGPEQRFRQVLHPTWEESEHGWSLDDDVTGHPSSVFP
jgi:hypothetical protein